jgi:hypothetical protein
VAGTVQVGTIGTEQVLPDERVISMDEKIKRLRPDETQFSTMTDKLSTQTTLREKYNWLEEDDFPRIATALNAQLVTDTTITFLAGQGKLFQPNDLLRSMRTGEGIRVVSIATDTVTVARGVGQIPAAAINANDVFLVIGDAQPQGSSFPTARYLARVLGYNYTQITRTPWQFTGTQTAIELYGGREPQKEAVRKAREHKRKWEAFGFFGARSYIAASASNGEPQGTAGGAVEFIQTNKVTASGTMTPTFFDSLVSNVMPYGDPGSKVLFASPPVVMNMSQWTRVGMGSYWHPQPENVFGVNVDAFISGAYGYRLPVVVKKEWAEFPYANQGYGGYAFLLDMSLIRKVPLRDRDTKLLTEQQAKGSDTYAAEYFREGTFEFALERAHGLIVGVTPPP